MNQYKYESSIQSYYDIPEYSWEYDLSIAQEDSLKKTGLSREELYDILQVLTDEGIINYESK